MFNHAKRNVKVMSFCMLTAMVTMSQSVIAAKDAGHGHDYRTFHSSGNIDYGEIKDSYTSDLVMYLLVISSWQWKNLLKISRARMLILKPYMSRPYHLDKS